LCHRRGTLPSVTSQTGAAFAAGGVFAFDGQTQPVAMRNTLISGNTVRASSGAGSVSVQGSGLMKAACSSSTASSSPQLRVRERTSGFAEGGFPVSQAHSLIVHNAPDQCFKC
jgi:hypothetical protein